MPCVSVTGCFSELVSEHLLPTRRVRRIRKMALIVKIANPLI